MAKRSSEEGWNSGSHSCNPLGTKKGQQKGFALLSCVLKAEWNVSEEIRANRSNPGVLPKHKVQIERDCQTTKKSQLICCDTPILHNAAGCILNSAISKA